MFKRSQRAHSYVAHLAHYACPGGCASSVSVKAGVKVYRCRPLRLRNSDAHRSGCCSAWLLLCVADALCGCCSVWLMLCVTEKKIGVGGGSCAWRQRIVSRCPSPGGRGLSVAGLVDVHRSPAVLGQLATLRLLTCLRCCRALRTRTHRI